MTTKTKYEISPNFQEKDWDEAKKLVEGNPLFEIFHTLEDSIVFEVEDDMYDAKEIIDYFKEVKVFVLVLVSKEYGFKVINKGGDDE